MISDLESLMELPGPHNPSPWAQALPGPHNPSPWAQAGGPFKDIDVTKIKVVWNSRDAVRNVDNLKNSISRVGLLEPIIVLDTGWRSDFRLVCGHRRLQAVTELGWPYIPSRILREQEIPESELRLMNVAENVSRDNLSLYETAKAVNEIHGKFGTSEDWMSKSTGLPKRRVHRMLLVWPNLSTTVKEKWSCIDSPDQEPRLSQLEEWSLMSWSEQNRSYKLWANDEDTPDELDEPISNSKKRKAKVKRRTKKEIAHMIRALGHGKYDQAQRRALEWAMGKRSTL